ncbi:MAG: ATP-dependent DNA helicase DinG, partial [Francisellaceae bacterium]
DVGLETNTSTKSLHSPFNYPESKLIVPNMKFFPQNKEYHIHESAKIISTYIKDNKKGIMVLFCSLSAMRQTLDLLPASQQNSIIMQGERSKIEIVKAHKKMIDRGLQSIIFGVDSFSEGIDLPGEYLETLIIHKIPFAVPSNPIEQSRNDWLIKQGKNPFIDFSLPIASIRLTQMVGRLIRSESDKGQVIILDKRLFAKKYGQNLLDNLPEFKVKIETNHG